jgi:hypothetical protein
VSATRRQHLCDGRLAAGDSAGQAEFQHKYPQGLKPEFSGKRIGMSELLVS